MQGLENEPMVFELSDRQVGNLGESAIATSASDLDRPKSQQSAMTSGQSLTIGFV